MAYVRRTKEQTIASGPKNTRVNSTLQKRTKEQVIAAGPKNTNTKAKAKTADQARAKATKKPLTASERAFLKNQREKAKAVKRTGNYPNTAN
jgi:hypothetical protein